MANYPSLETAFQGLLGHLSPAQSARVSHAVVALVLAGTLRLSALARWLPRPIRQHSRLRWLRRLLDAPFLSQERLYQPFLRRLLPVHAAVWHLVIDRTTVSDGVSDLAVVSLHMRKRALPLVWCAVPFGGAPLADYVALVQRCLPLIPPTTRVVLHGDTEFGGRQMLSTLRGLGWDFMLAQSSRVTFQRHPAAPRQPLATLTVAASRTVVLTDVSLFAEHPLAGLTLLAFGHVHYSAGKRKREMCYVATSLPPTAGLRRLGRRRWATEPMFRDFKSSGWQLSASQVSTPTRREGLLVLAALAYVWLTCCGRWLCQAGQRRQIDDAPPRQRRLSLFRLGRDWLVHRLRCGLPLPAISTFHL